MVSANNTPGGSRFCANCGTPLDPNSQFCGNCGQPAAGPAPAASWAPPVAPPPSMPYYAPPVAPPPTMPYYSPPVAPAQSGGNARCLIIAGIAVLGLLLVVCCGGLGIYWLTQVATPTPTASPFPLRPTNTPTPTAPAPAPATATVAAATATPTALPRTATPVASATATATATATTKPAVTATTTATATATPKPSATVTRAPTPSVLFMDDFSSQQASLDKGWSLDPGTNVDYVWAQGKLTISVKKQQIVGLDWPHGDYLDFAAEGEAQPMGADFANYGMVFRVSGQTNATSYYMFGLKTDGRYYLYQRVGGAWIDLDAVAPTAASQIKQGSAKNTFGVIVQGNKISLLINRVLVKTVVDNSITTAGRVGFFAGTGDNVSCSVAFTKLTILTVEKAKADWGVP